MNKDAKMTGGGEKIADGVVLPIYLDNHATTPMDPRVLDEMLPYFRQKFGNAASSNHSFGWTGAEAVHAARDRIAKLIGASAREIIFTSGATESDNLAIKGVAEMYREKGDHIITAVTEHKAVLDSCKRLEKAGYRVTYLAVQNDGLIDLDELKRAMSDKTILVTIMAANNETGVLQPWAQIGHLCHERGVIFHTDATQAIGKVSVDVIRDNVDLLSISAHKMYGPKGVGALYVRKGTRLAPVAFGGHHERDRRPGTENVPGIAAFGAAAELSGRRLREDSARLAVLRDRLESMILDRIPGAGVNGSKWDRTPNTSNLYFDGVDGEAMVIALDLKGLAVSTGAACSSGAIEPSHVLTAMGLAPERARASIRFSIGKHNNEDDIDFALSVIPATIARLRELSPTYSR